MVLRRAVLGGVASALAAGAGCSTIFGSGVQFSSSVATVADATWSATGYEEVEVKEVVLTPTFSAAGQERTVEVTNHLARYERRIDLPLLPAQRAAVFVVFTTPKVELFGRTFNPVGGMSNRELLELLQSRYTGLSIGDRVGQRSVTMLGRETTVTKYEGSGTIAGASVDVFVHLARVEHAGDFVIALAVYPQPLSGEEDAVMTMIEGIEHGG